MENNLKILFSEVERHTSVLIGRESFATLSKEESKILALQAIHRLNQRIGFLFRTRSKESGEMKLLQTYVNNLTLGVKNDNQAQIRSALNSIRNIIETISSSIP
jgi:hypothetical protein